MMNSYSYDAYGNLLGSTGTSENDYLYRGEQFDESLDLQYLRALSTCAAGDRMA
ncbi:MAG: hypothetical protein AAGA60_32210 [Cyanobacteria bacterium P01_E01_bin.42]